MRVYRGILTRYLMICRVTLSVEGKEVKGKMLKRLRGTLKRCFFSQTDTAVDKKSLNGLFKIWRNSLQAACACFPVAHAYFQSQTNQRWTISQERTKVNISISRKIVLKSILIVVQSGN